MVSLSGSSSHTICTLKPLKFYKNITIVFYFTDINIVTINGLSEYQAFKSITKARYLGKASYTV